MKKFILLSLAVLLSIFLLSIQAVNAQMGSMMNGKDSTHSESIEEVLKDLLLKQKVDTIQKLDCKQVGDDNLESMGEAVMEQQHPGAVHEVMDQMMGGEGSQSLKSMHISIGRAYLGCSSDNSFAMGGMMNMMGGVPMMGFGSMMGYGNSLFDLIGILIVLTLIALIIFLFTGAYFFIKQAGKK